MRPTPTGPAWTCQGCLDADAADFCAGCYTLLCPRCRRCGCCGATPARSGVAAHRLVLARPGGGLAARPGQA